MPNYSKGKVYKITSGNLTYIGSTVAPTLAIRLAQHRSKYKNWKEGKTKLTSFQVLEKGDYEITLIELCPCQSRDELSARERYWIENMVCVNRQHPGRTPAEYYQANKDKINAREKEWREKNKEALKARSKVHYDANSEVLLARKKVHYDANSEVLLARKKVHYDANSEVINAARRVHYDANKEEINAARRARRKPTPIL